MVTIDSLIEFCASGRKQRDVLIAVLGSLNGNAPVRALRLRGLEAGVRDIDEWNISAVLARSQGLVVQVNGTWKLTNGGWELVASFGIEDQVPRIARVAVELRTLIDDSMDQGRKDFLSEALTAFEYGLHRSAVVLSWVGAIQILHEHVAQNHLAAFNSAGVAQFPKFVALKNVHGFQRVFDADFLLLCEKAGIFGKAIKIALEERLKDRNNCGHANPLPIGENQVASHLEILIKVVFSKY